MIGLDEVKENINYGKNETYASGGQPKGNNNSLKNMLQKSLDNLTL